MDLPNAHSCDFFSSSFLFFPYFTSLLMIQTIARATRPKLPSGSVTSYLQRLGITTFVFATPSK
jgi:hypothetical protein